MDVLYKLDSLNIPYLPAANKRPAVQWREYLKRPPASGEVEQWRRAGLFDGGIGVVLARYNGLIAVDLDKSEQVDQFQRVGFPDSYSEVTPRGGMHVLYRISAPAEYPAYTAGPRGELAANRFLMIAPSPGYRALTDIGCLRQISHSTCRDLLAYFAPAPAIDLQAEFWRAAQAAQSRNRGLFAAALAGRRAGLTKQQVLQALRDVFINAPAFGRHQPESKRERERECIATITSAFKAYRAAGPGLPTRIREALLQAGADQAARMLDGLLLAGFRPGEQVAIRQVLEAFERRGIPLTERMIRQALQAELAGAPIFETRAASGGRGRPALLYRIPDITLLADACGVKVGGSTPLRPEDLASASSYAQAVHVDLISRAPGRYSLDLLTTRVNRSRRTIRRYNRRAGIRVTQQCETVELRAGTAKYALANVPSGCWLDVDGQRLPPRADLAESLLAAGRRVLLVKQLPNHYSAE
ncbi:bifunctional DNA primase/polymerase [Candidatus Roseilinea sp. NK_OTU-006]|jgi:hypothetical protein|uniref:bifunctional DNA primase/polymerase n=1 Tax=Candidatus Roseilinea sp. NK_OTU-006 TaxID=2704250 RepID=UPI00145D5557|nr:bifunctional DNA primase/polymerase [Candidatus Roseilinea sp. NK_OTU-006]